MRLSEIDAWRVLRDGDFESLGYLFHDATQMLTFLDDEGFAPQLTSHPSVSCVLTTAALAEHVPSNLGVAICDHPRAAFLNAHDALHRSTDFYWKPFVTRIHPTARIDPSASVADTDVDIGPGVVVEARAVIYPRSLLEEGVRVRAGTVVGCEGFEFKPEAEGVRSIPHAGGVRLRRGVEVQSLTVLDRALFGGFTELGEDTKVDNLVHIAHHARTGKRCRIAAQAQLAGSVRLGNDVWVGPQALVSTGVRVGDGAAITVAAIITRDVEAGQRMASVDRLVVLPARPAPPRP